jgi:hypothetical protein
MLRCVAVSVAAASDCIEHRRLLNELAQAIDLLVKTQASHAIVLRTTGSATTGYEEDLTVAAAAWTVARRAFTQHVMEHGC